MLSIRYSLIPRPSVPVPYSLIPVFTIVLCNFYPFSRRRTDAFPPEAFTPELNAREGQRVKELYASGLLRQIWKRGDVAGAAIVWEAASEAVTPGFLVTGCSAINTGMAAGS